ncbi:C40 family peptidase [Mycobacterium cookii]|uniref:NLP/P60 family protein n=1 Tax=Mycobacterium cookii TaxID=1775 RepID=A0A7I7KZ35_9MYCO|nr:C40 family peptidase [Mycobacterium cookii]MCV7333311.1 C40 family peptidase [Mycobacterium cookii]BBX47097.1 NLP/P60 family protein [Mycobacterium cookii]
MSGSDVAALSRAHQLFAGSPADVALDAPPPRYDALLQRSAALNSAGGQQLYKSMVDRSRDALHSAAATDGTITATIAEARRDHAVAHALTKSVLDEARADTAIADNPIAQREAIRRRVARLHAQQAHVLAARRKARRHRSRWHPVSYRMFGHAMPGSRAGIAVRAALSRLGRPYVWGATGPDQFDCSGLTQWSYARAGIHLDRTTYQQIYDGVPVPRSQVRPGDLVFPSAGHVQLAIGHNLVVEAPHSGATVRISPLGAGVQIRRPLG